MTTDFTAERERLADLLLWHERASAALHDVHGGLTRYLETREALTDWRAASVALRRPIPRQTRDDFGAAFAFLVGALHRLRDSAHHLQGLCRSPADELLARWSRGCAALAATVSAGVDRDGTAGELADSAVDVARVRVLLHGLNRIAHRIGEEARHDARAHLQHHAAEVADWRAAGRHHLADQLDGGDPAIARCLEAIRAVANRESADLY